MLSASTIVYVLAMYWLGIYNDIYISNGVRIFESLHICHARGVFDGPRICDGVHIYEGLCI